jgi:hypothetical protein
VRHEVHHDQDNCCDELIADVETHLVAGAECTSFRVCRLNSKGINMSDTSPRDQSRLLWNAKRQSAREPKPGELLSATAEYSYRVELRDHGQWGVDVQFICDGWLHYSRMCPTRDLGFLLATHERDEMVKSEP